MANAGPMRKGEKGESREEREQERGGKRTEESWEFATTTMSSDVQMADAPAAHPPTSSPPPPPSTATSRRSSLTNTLTLSTDPPSALPLPKPASTATKPKSTKPPKQRSPSPSPPPPPPPPLQTIRLEIKLGGPSNYEVDIATIAKATGQRPPTPVVSKRDISDSEGDDADEDDKDKAGGKKSKKKKKNANSEYYDVSDPFIDDSELAIDERTYFAQTKQQGFYVSSGEVALLKDNPKKPKSKKPLASTSTNKPTDPTPGPSTLTSSHPKKHIDHLKIRLSDQDGTRDSPIALTSDVEDEHKHRPGAEGVENERAGEKRKRYITIVEGGKKRKVVDVHSFHPDLQGPIEELRAAINGESWDQKSKFPPSLKPLLSQLAVLAIRLDEYDEHFFNLMPTLFPYNKFTMSKLIKRTVFHDHTTLLMQRQETLLAELKEQAQRGFAKAEEEWERSVIAWDKRQEKARAEAVAGSATATTSPHSTIDPATDSTVPSRHPTEEMDVDVSVSISGVHASVAGTVTGDGDQCGAGEGGKEKEKDRDQHAPAKKYRMTEVMKGIVWQLVLLSNECCRLENEKNTLEGSVLQVSEQGSRKVLYQKIVAAFPEGWMSSGQISRDVSSMKKRFEKEAMENED